MLSKSALTGGGQNRWPPLAKKNVWPSSNACAGNPDSMDNLAVKIPFRPIAQPSSHQYCNRHSMMNTDNNMPVPLNE